MLETLMQMHMILMMVMMQITMTTLLTTMMVRCGGGDGDAGSVGSDSVTAGSGRILKACRDFAPGASRGTRHDRKLL